MFAFTSSAVVAALIVSSFALPMPDAGAKPFTLQNGEDAQALNAKFASLTPTSQCNDGEDACVNGQFAQCANGKFVLSDCAAGTICAALPLVNKPGTSVTCTTAADRDARIAATGATGGSGAANAAASSAATAPAAGAAAAPAASAAAAPAASAAAAPAAAPAAGSANTGGPVNHLQNGKEAQAANAKSATLTPDSPCTDGENACINDQFAQCVNGKFELTPCGSGLVCRALPLLDKPGISNTCDTIADATQRIQNTGAGSIDGS